MAYNTSARNEVEEELKKIEKHHNLYFPHSTVRMFKSRHKIWTRYCNENNEV